MTIALLTAPLRKAMIEALKGSPAVAAYAGDRVFTYVPKKPEYPYIRFEQPSAIPYENNCGPGADIRGYISGFIARDALALDNAEQFGSAAIAALDDQDLSLDTGSVISLSVDSFQVLQDQGDQSLLHWVLRYTAITAQSRN